MSENRRTPGSAPGDAFEARLARYLDWEARQAGGARTGIEVAASIATGPISRRWGGNAGLVLAVVVIALVAVAVAVAIAGRPPQQLVTAPSIEASVTPTAAAETDAPTNAAATEDPDPTCIQFDAEATYTSAVGTLPVSVTVPARPGTPWRGKRDIFLLGKASCDPNAGASPYFNAALVGRVYADACRWKTSEVEVPTAFKAAQELAKQKGHETTAPVETRVGAFRATRLDIAVPSGFDLSACDDAQMTLWGDMPIEPGISMQVYIAEVDGVTLVITASYDPAETTSADRQDIQSILASLRVDM